MIYSATAKGPFKIPGFHDRDNKRLVGIIYRPDVWAANTVYYVRAVDDYDVVVPTNFKGLYFKAISPGLSGAVEPIWPTTVGETVTDGVTWEAVAYNLLPPTESIVTSNFTATDSVTLTNSSNTANTTQTMISAVPAGVTVFSITNHIVKSNGEENDITLQFKVAER